MSRRLLLVAVACCAVALMSAVGQAAPPERILFAASGELYTMAPDGTDVVNITNTPDVNEAEPTGSPDGRWIAYIQGRSKPELWVMDATGSSRRRVTSEAAQYAEYPTWAPDSLRLAYIGPGYGPWTINLDGTEATPLTDGPIGAPFWSPDGTRIAFPRPTQPGPYSYWDIFVLELATGTEQRLTNTNGDDGWPTWSPDGSKIAFSSGRNGHHYRDQVYMMNADGSGQTAITDNNYSNVQASWSPDGRRVIFTKQPVGSHGGDIWTIDIHTGAEQRVTSTPGVRKLAPQWWFPVTNERPVADAGGPYAASVTAAVVDIDPDTLNVKSKGRWVTGYFSADPGGTAPVQLDGSSSHDPDGDALEYFWVVMREGSADVVAEFEGVCPSAELPPGEYMVGLIVDDGEFPSENDAFAPITVLGLDLASVDPTGIFLNRTVPGQWGDMQSAATMMVKFSRLALIPTLIPEQENLIDVSGALSGEDTIMVIDRGGKRK